jgi:hypothetical protein
MPERLRLPSHAILKRHEYETKFLKTFCHKALCNDSYSKVKASVVHDKRIMMWSRDIIGVVSTRSIIKFE